jgi:hypothetical protein
MRDTLHFNTNAVAVSQFLLLHCEDNITIGVKEKEKKSIMRGHLRVLTVTIGCAIILGLVIGLGARRNNNSKFEGAGGGGGELCYCHLLYYLICSM